MAALVLFCSCGDRPLVHPEADVAFASAPVKAPREWKRFRRTLAANGSDSLLVVQHGKIVHEWYASGRDRSSRHYVASLAKSLIGGMTLAVALDHGWLTLESRVAEFYPAWSEDPVKSRITVGQLAAHASGLADAEAGGLPHSKLTGWQGGFWKRDPEQDPFTLALTQTPVEFEPGARFGYSNPGYAVLAFTISAAALRAGEADPVEALYRERMEPAGIPRDAWSAGYGQRFDIDGVEATPNWGGAAYTARAAARVGGLLLADWPAGRAVIQPSGLPAGGDAPGSSPLTTFGWYSNGNRAFEQLPPDAFVGAGAGHQVLLVIPSMELVAVRFGGLLAPATELPFWQAVDEQFFRPLMSALQRPEVEASRSIGSVRFGDEIVCRAESSDNWPLTWADDDLIYTSYGDGWGFVPKLDTKLSLGLATIAGDAESFRGENLRAPEAERTGDGPAGAKASGMLAVDSALYMWVRNLDNAQLAWSDDDGLHWSWGFKFEESFGSPSFLNFGRAHAGAKDDWIYTFSQAGESAYESDDAVVLARAPRRRLRERDAWEFFAGIDGGGAPVWSDEIGRRRPVLVNPGAVARLDVVHHPGLDRYLLALGYDLEGGWGLFDAPQPWGPWTLVFHTPDWGLGATHSYRIPSKWISMESHELALVFSGRRFEGRSFDGFCVRMMSLQTATDSIGSTDDGSEPIVALPVTN